ncbi:MAG: twin-arginine translocase subunit TatC [Flavobacteriia bacterium]|nr:twin-arginine translocase subunit TatC [Flavobacteriia bacterium]OIP46520.1 MAG: twin arginine-targeting protein translocase TatC [Flavobacteriaceae bacterium CG2_30_31_66]PIV96463.1 MAG: twin-arginine translocase subunit TatC [Flavobacteriaceae bacterium CG17_big_fil_post_rev_8_21_14_2_50_31_13]PIX14543.1 MAG: twin-arginine translocase subunit TatC [Flavobacteriaceae bacterium CG_4_8_14_3_um_filter_31_8]PIY15084.1 MAG: twin-arginine translocase subunit TatC [Flavobacteriaceae bacterium CG_4
MAVKEKEMSFLGHLEELRWHLVRSASAIIILAVVFFVYSEQVYDYFLLAHIQPDFITYKVFCDFFNFFGLDSAFCHVSFADKKLQSIEVTSQLMNSLWSSIILGLIIAFPYLLWEMWRFVAPGLTQNERNKSRGFIFIASLLFFIGVWFSFYVIAPISIHFLYNFQISDNIENNFTLQSHISLVTNLLLGVSIIFELPVVIYFLAKIGLITPEFLKKYRKHALVIVLIIAAIITPPDVASQIIVTIPILILYEIGIVVSRRVIKNQLKDAQKSKRV